MAAAGMSDTPPEATPDDIELRGEALLAVVGLGRVLAPDRFAASARHLEDAAGLADEIRRRVARFVNGKKPGPRAAAGGTLDYDAVSAKVARAMAPDLLAEALAATATDGDMALAFAAALGRALQAARDAMPATHKPTLVGAAPKRPSDTDLARFRRTWGVLDDGMTVLDRLEAGTLSADEVRTFALVFPQLYRVARLGFFEAIAEKLTESPDFTVNGNKGRLLSRLLQVQLSDVEALQAAFGGEEEPEGGGGGGGGGRTMKDKLSTSVQKLAQGE